jgi:hypothetical protein
MIQKLYPAEWCLMVLVWLSTGLSSAAGPPVRVTHILGLESISNNASGNLLIREGALRFQKDEGPAVQIPIAAIQDVFQDQQDQQVGGVPMALGRAATPFGGGRVIALFSHKKYDTLTVEYLDPSGGLHGTIFQMNKGQGQVLRDELLAAGAHITQQSPSEVKK